MNCLNCGLEHANPKFCSMKCSAIYNNKLFVKRKKRSKSGLCKICSGPTYARYIYCDNCRTKDKDMTIKDACGRNDANRYNKIRVRARTAAKKAEILKSCFNCGYDKHVECCHVKDISSFPETTMVSEVNDISNLVGLCPNCHWEFDNHLLTISRTPGS